MMRVCGTVGVLLITLAAVPACDAADVVDFTLKVTRKSDDNGSLCGMDVFVDGQKVGSLGNGETKTFTVSGVKVGGHTVGNKSYEFFGGVKEEDEKTVFIAGPNAVVRFTTSWSFGMNEFSGQNAFEFGNAKVVSVSLDTNLKDVVVKKSPPIKLAAGSSKVVEDTIRIKHSVTVSDGWKTEAGVKSSVQTFWPSIEGGIRYEVQHSKGQTYEVETERKRSVTINGGGSSEGTRVVWVEYYRTGTAKVMIGKKEVQVPFEFKEDFDLLTEDAK